MARSERDFPFYDGRPVGLSAARWLGVLACVAAGFAALVGLPTLWPGPVGAWVSVVLFVGLPLGGLAMAAGRHWLALFPRPTWRDVRIGLAFLPLTILASALVGWLLYRAGLTAANPAAVMAQSMTGGDLALFLLRAAPQLVGEELLTILPFLALLTLFTARLGLKTRLAVILAWLLSALLFGALHLPTYQWHLAQAFGVIGVARLMLTLPYLITRSVWASSITHIANDTLLFLTVFGLAGMRAG